MGELAEDFAYMKEVKAKERAAKEPNRVAYATEHLQKAGHTVQQLDDKTVRVDGHITFWPFTGWYSGKGVGSGRGVHNLIKKLRG